MKLTDWFDGIVKPVRIGVYQQNNRRGEIGYQRWDGVLWYGWCRSAAEANLEEHPACGACQNDDWRGLAQEPKP